MYIDNEKEKHLQDIDAALRELDHLDTMIEMEKKKNDQSQIDPHALL